MTRDQAIEAVARVNKKFTPAKNVARAQDSMLDYIRAHFQHAETRAAIRSALGDAAHLCDALARDIEDAHRSKRGQYIRQEGQALAAAMRQAGDMFWQFRECV